MRTAREIVHLLLGVGRLWQLAWLPLVAWACVGWSLRQLGLYGSAALGGAVPQLSILIFILGVVGHVACLVLMINALEPKLPLLRAVAERQADASAEATEFVVPTSVFQYSTRLGALVTAIGPFLAVYALWGLVEDQIRELFEVNVIRHSVLGTEQWSINLQHWQGYAVLALVAWLLKLVLGAVVRRRRHQVWRFCAVMIDGVFVFTSFLALTRILADGGEWLQGRAVWVGARRLWRQFVDLLPDVLGDLALKLPELVPGFVDLVLLPLMWLALAAVVFGWRDFDNSVASTKVESMRTRLSRVPAPLRRLGWLATTDLREKYIPVIRSLQLLWQAGPRFLGATLVGWSVLTAVQRLIESGLNLLRGPVPLADSLLTAPLIDLVQWVVGTTLLMSLLGVAFDRCIGELTQPKGPSAQRRISAQPESS